MRYELKVVRANEGVMALSVDAMDENDAAGQAQGYDVLLHSRVPGNGRCTAGREREFVHYRNRLQRAG